MAARRRPERSSISPAWRALCVQCRRPKRRHWPRAPTAPKVSTPCGIIFIAVKSCTAWLLSREYAEERRKLITEQASLEFRPGRIGENPPQHPFYSEIARRNIDDALLAKDTTCVDAIDKDGVAFSATPSGAWMPSYIAGDTGVPLTQRAQSFLLVPGHPNELQPGKRPRVTLSPTLVTAPDKTIIALSTPGGDNQDQSLMQVLFNSIFFGMNAQFAEEAG